MNTVALSSDRKVMTVISGDRTRRATIQSARPDGFTPEQVDYARTSLKWPNTDSTDATWRKTMFGHPVYVHLSAGPPTWWTPSIRVRRRFIGCGWLRVAVGLSW